MCLSNLCVVSEFLLEEFMMEMKANSRARL